MLELKDTVKGMNNKDYKERFVAEYQQLTIRRNKLKKFIEKIDIAKHYGVIEEPKHDCPFGLLIKQLNIMDEYAHILEERAIIENIELGV